MRAPSRTGRTRLAVAVIAAVVAASAGCGSDSKDTGPPALVRFLAAVPGEPEEVDLLMPVDAGAPSVSGLANFKLVFNKLLDGDKIEAVVDGRVMGKTDVASITWPGAPPGAPVITASTTYDPSGALAINTPGPKVRVAAAPGLPSGAQLVVRLDRSKITSKTGAPFTGPDMQMVATDPFAVGANVKDGDNIAIDRAVELSFTNAQAADIASHIQVIPDGVPAVPEIKRSSMPPRVVSVLPASGAWSAGQAYTLTVDKDAADLFGIKLAQPFVVKFVAGAKTSDGGPLGDGPVVDGGSGAGGGALDAATDVAEADATSDAPAGG